MAILFSFLNRRRRRIPSWIGYGVRTKVANVRMMTYYHSIRTMKKWMGDQFELLEVQGLSIFIPPSYYRSFPQRLPTIFNFLSKLEKRFSRVPPFNRLGDFIILTFKYQKGEQNAN